MQFKRYLILTLSLLVLACGKESFDTPAASGPVTVGFVVGGADTRTTINDDGISSSWEKGDRIALWATSQNGTATLSAQQFGLYYRDGSLAMFTATLPSAMAEGTYNYWATYPAPKSVNGTKATFNLPNTQDGTMSGGAAIMVAQPAQGPQLSKVTDIPKPFEIYDGHLSLQMKHATHALRFFAPSNKWGFNDGEKIERIQFTMPQGIAGDLTLDYTDLDAARTTANTSNTISLNLTKPIGASASASALDHACAAILPTAAFAAGDELEVRAFTSSQAARCYISLEGRDAMQAGHITPVSIDCTSVVARHAIRFVWSGNNLGEDVHTITFRTTAGDEVYKITDVADFEKRGIHDIDFTFEDKTYLASIAGQQMIVEYESEHALVKNTITIPSDVATAVKCHEIPITVPYLFFEDFSLLKGYDINGGNVSTKKQDGSNINDTFFYSGWTGNQTSGKAGTAIRIRTRNETTWAFYNGRVDSAPISGLKAGVSIKVSVSFDYNAVTEESGDECMSFSYGYTTTQGPIKAYYYYFYIFGTDTGGSHIENSITKSLPSASNLGSFNNDTYPSSYHTIDNFVINKCTNQHRLSWEPLASGESNHAANSKNHWLYIDNIKVSIAK